jgi:hypothetical protein
MRLGKLDPDGQLLWRREFADAWLGHAQAIAVDEDDEPVFTGEILGTVRFDDIVLRSVSSTFQDLFVAKTDAGGNVRWAMRGGGGTRGARGWNLIADAHGGFYLGIEVYGANSSFDGLNIFGATLARVSPSPWLNIASHRDAVTVAWPAKATNHVLEATTSLPALAWDAVTNTPTITTSERSVQLPLTGPTRCLRLRRP